MSAPAVSVSRGASLRLPARLMGDDRLAALAAGGDVTAFDALYRRHQPVLYRYCRAMVRHEQDAQDVLQSTMTRAFTRLADKSPDAPVRAWLFRIAHNEAVDLLRRRRNHADTSAAESIPAPGHEDALEARDRLRVLVDDLQVLPERQRTALVMRELSGCSHREIGAALEMSPSGAKQAILDARLSLAECEKGRAMDCAEVGSIISARDGRKLRGRPLRAHLRGCPDCRRLRDAIAPRQADLAVLAPPLPAATAAALLANVIGGGASGGTGGGLVAAGGAAKVASAALLGKAIAAGAVIATAGVVTEQAVRDRDPRAKPAAPAAEGRPGPPGRGAPAPAVATAADEPRSEGRPAKRARAQARRRAVRRAARRAEPKRASRITAPAAAATPARPESPRARGRRPEPKARGPKPKTHPAHPAHPAKPPKPKPAQPKPHPTPKPHPSPKPRPTPEPPAPTAAPVEPPASEPQDEGSKQIGPDFKAPRASKQ